MAHGGQECTLGLVGGFGLVAGTACLLIQAGVVQRNGSELRKAAQELDLFVAKRAVRFEAIGCANDADDVGAGCEGHAHGSPDHAAVKRWRAARPGVIVIHHQWLARLPDLSGQAFARPQVQADRLAESPHTHLALKDASKRRWRLLRPVLSIALNLLKGGLEGLNEV